MRFYAAPTSKARSTWSRPVTASGRLRRGRVDLTVAEWRAVFARYGRTCHLCGQLIPRNTYFPHPLSPSVDHLIPVSRGGSNSISNLRPAHLRCNTNRSNKTLSGSVRFAPDLAQVTGEELLAAVVSQRSLKIGDAHWVPLLRRPVSRKTLRRHRIARRLSRWNTVTTAVLLVTALGTGLALDLATRASSNWLLATSIAAVMICFVVLSGMRQIADPRCLALSRITGWEIREVPTLGIDSDSGQET